MEGSELSAFHIGKALSAEVWYSVLQNPVVDMCRDMWLLHAGVCGCYVQGYVVAMAGVCGCYVQGYVVAMCRDMW